MGRKGLSIRDVKVLISLLAVVALVSRCYIERQVIETKIINQEKVDTCQYLQKY